MPNSEVPCTVPPDTSGEVNLGGDAAPRVALAGGTATLRQITFKYQGRSCTAVIEREITNWLGSSGAVIAITEGTEGIEVQTRSKQETVRAILIPLSDVIARLYSAVQPAPS